jgi:hypothetical protein
MFPWRRCCEGMREGVLQPRVRERGVMQLQQMRASTVSLLHFLRPRTNQIAYPAGLLLQARACCSQPMAALCRVKRVFPFPVSQCLPVYQRW